MTQAQGPFTQLPYSLWTYPGLSIHERWLAATIIRLCWKPGPQPFSYQRLAKEAGLSTGALCTKGKDDQAREGMIPHLEREGLVKVYRPVNEEGQVIRGKAFLIEPTEKLWQMNTSCSRSVYRVNTQPPPVNTTVYDVNTPVYGVNTPVYGVNTEEGITSSQKRVEEAPYIKIDSIDSLDKKIEDSLVVSAHAENDVAGLTFLSSLSSFEETLHDVQQEETTRRDTEPLTQNRVIPSFPVLLQQKDKRKTSSQRKTVKKGKYQKEEDMPLCSARAIREGIDALRGYALDQGGPLIQQNKVIKLWCQGHTLEEFQQVISHLTTGQCHDEKHQWWRKNGRMKTYFNAAKLADLTPGCLACGCADISPPDDQFSCIPKGYNAADEFRQYYGINEPREVEHATV